MENSSEKLTYKEAFEQLQKIVEQLESETVELEQAMELYKAGMQLSKYCSSLLEQAELKIRTIGQTTVNGDKDSVSD